MTIYLLYQDLDNLFLSLSTVLNIGEIQFEAVGNNEAAQVLNAPVLRKGREVGLYQMHKANTKPNQTTP